MITTPTLGDFGKAHGLTPEQSRIVAALLRGLENKPIAEELRTTPQCIKNELRRIYGKVQIKGKTPGKRLKLLVMIRSWAKEEKSTRVRARMQ